MRRANSNLSSAPHGFHDLCVSVFFNVGGPPLRRRRHVLNCLRGSGPDRGQSRLPRVPGSATRSARQSKTTRTSRTQQGAASREPIRRSPPFLSQCKNAAQRGADTDTPSRFTRIPRSREARIETGGNTCSCPRNQNPPCASTGASHGVRRLTDCSRRSPSPQDSQLLVSQPLELRRQALW